VRPRALKATREQTRVHNSRLVLRTIYECQEISRADVARETRLTRTTVSDVVADLMDEGLLEEVGYGPSVGGKPPILLSIVSDSRHLIGIDLASEEFRGAVVNLRGQIRHRIDVPLCDRDGEAALALVYQIIENLVAGMTCHCAICCRSDAVCRYTSPTIHRWLPWASILLAMGRVWRTWS
jgi:N-acetylglucosamine repressor